MFDKIQSFLESIVGPIANKMNDSKTIKALTNGMMSILPVTLGVAFIAIVGQLPIPAWQEFLTQIGIAPLVTELANVTSGLYALYIVVAIAYETAKIEETNPITAIVLSLAFFLILCPELSATEDGWTSYAIATSTLGSDGIFVAMLTGLLVTRFFAFMMRWNKLTIKLPDTVPPMVTESLSPTFVAMVIFLIAFVLKAIFAFTPYGDILTFVNSIITAPISALGSSPFSVVLIFTFANLLWFFGIHPAAIINIFYAITAPIFLANVEAFLQGQPMPYLEFMFMTGIISIGGTGNTLGLAFDMLLAKSERYKVMRPLTFVPSLFNINEPFIFGLPIMLNPIYFIPLITSVIVPGIIVHIFYSIGFLNYMNPVIELPWVMPPVISNFIYGGMSYAIVMVICIIALALLYYPFFKMADNKHLAEEQEAAKKLQSEK